MIHVPYKGTGPVMTDLVGGQINLSFANMLAALPLVRNKRLVPIGVTSLKRSAALPDVPALAEAAPGFEAVSWWGIVATKGTPADIVDALYRAIAKGLKAPDTHAFLSNMGVEAAGTTPREFAAFIQSEKVKWAKVVKDSGARAE
jgi:tripartite-type tricarboxylate transporter receptor subunit TctC